MAATEEVYTNFFEVGKFFCASCGNYLYKSGDKFHSPGKLPAFVKAATEDSVLLEEDFSVGILRTVIVCKQCSKEIGNVYNDAQQVAGTEGHQRHTVSSKNLRFEANPEGGQPQLTSEPAPAAPAASIEVVEKKEAPAENKDASNAAAAAVNAKRTAAQARQLLKEMSDSDSDSDSDSSSSSEEAKPAAKKGGNAAKAPAQPSPAKKPVQAAATQKPAAKKQESSAGSYLAVLALGAAAIAAGFVGYRYYAKRDGGK